MTESWDICRTGFVEEIEQAYSVSVLKTLLLDRTTRKNIIWADNEYEALGAGYSGKDEITIEAITGTNSGVIKPRVAKERERQSQRTKSRAEVFTPSWLCNQMNNYLDEEWFGRKNVFNEACDGSWLVSSAAIDFPSESGRNWKDYVDCRKLEITCGEAPFICSRYDTVTGRVLPILERIGMLDRKLRVVNENAQTENDWLKWAFRALESMYGYEYQGDNLIIARINVLQTFAEYLKDRWGRVPTEDEIAKAVKIVSWNIWQMDGLSDTPPSDKPTGDIDQMSIFELVEKEWQAPFCKIYDWRAGRSQTFASMKSERNET